MDQQPEQQEPRYVCPACAAEGNAEPQPITNFYSIRSQPYKNSEGRVIVKYKDNLRRSELCKRHDNVQRAEQIRRQLDPNSPEYNPEARRKLQARQRKYEQEVRKKGGARYKKRIRKAKKKEEE
jgi:hypothetical protein